tara:strand:+ start:268 stop:993 length:726 start_codon:yes stop_codon:yes gene_type:complete
MLQLSYSYEELDKITKNLSSFKDILSKYFNIEKLETYNEYFQSLTMTQLQSNYKDIYEQFYLIEYRINKLPIEIWNIVIKYYLYDYIYKLKIPLDRLNINHQLSLILNTDDFENENRYIRIFNNFEFIDIDNIPDKNYDHNVFKSINFTDICYRHCGMGHFICLSYDKNFKKFYFREEGGSNAYEIADNNMEALEFEKHPEYEAHLLTFKQAIDIIKFESSKYLDEIPTLYHNTLNRLLNF